MRGCLYIKPGGTAEVKAFVPVKYRDESLFLFPKISSLNEKKGIFHPSVKNKVMKHDYTKLQ
jgi:hypothetical protein